MLNLVAYFLIGSRNDKFHLIRYMKYIFVYKLVNINKGLLNNFLTEFY